MVTNEAFKDAGYPDWVHKLNCFNVLILGIICLRFSWFDFTCQELNAQHPETMIFLVHLPLLALWAWLITECVRTEPNSWWAPFLKDGKWADPKYFEELPANREKRKRLKI